ncbi:MAG: NfeD family protein [Bacteroidales bacterium]
MWLVILSLIVIGLVFILLELLVVPGTTVVGFIGFAMVAGGVYLSYSEYGSFYGTITLLSTAVFSVVMVALSIRSGTWKRIMLVSEINSKVNELESDKVKVGDEGNTVTRLNPVGKAIINDEYYEVVSKDNLIGENQEIVVTKVVGNKIIVKLKT